VVVVYRSDRDRGSGEIISMSSYVETLPSEARARYKEKISLIGGVDPFTDSLGDSTSAVPPINASDLVSYLVLQTSFLTAKQFKAHKSLESYNQFVKEVHTWKKTGKFLTTAHVCITLLFWLHADTFLVRHSQ